MKRNTRWPHIYGHHADEHEVMEVLEKSLRMGPEGAPRATAQRTLTLTAAPSAGRPLSLRVSEAGWR
jgi:hypothetical protein